MLERELEYNNKRFPGIILIVLSALNLHTVSLKINCASNVGTNRSFLSRTLSFVLNEIVNEAHIETQIKRQL